MIYLILIRKKLNFKRNYLKFILIIFKKSEKFKKKIKFKSIISHPNKFNRRKIVQLFILNLLKVIYCLIIFLEIFNENELEESILRLDVMLNA